MDKWFKAMNKRQHTLLPMWPGFAVLGGLIYKELLIPNQLTYYENGLVDYYADSNDSFTVSKELLNLTRSNELFWKEYDTKVYDLGRKYLSELYEYKYKKNFSNWDNKNLVIILEHIIKMLEFQGGTLTLARILPLKELDNFLSEKLGNSQDIQRAHGIFRTPIRTSWPEIEIKTFLEIAISYKEGKITDQILKEKISDHIKNFGWITTDLHYNSPLSRDELLQRLQKELEGDPEEKLFKLVKRAEDRIKQKELLINKLKPSKYMKGIIGLLGFEIWLKTYRRYFTTQVVYYTKDFFYEIAKRAKLENDNIWWTTPKEIYNFLLQRENFPREEILQRSKKMVLLTENNKNKFVYGKEAKKIINDQIVTDEVVYTKVMNGTPVSFGETKGFAKVVLDHSSIDSIIEDGDIIVATQAPPSFIRAIQKSNGIVVEEGAITSHAAILAREFNKPCVVGIKNATKIIKTGDEVNIDTDKGTVEIL